MKLLFILSLLLQASLVHALLVDEKLPLRILKTSKTKKTILINRGLEDGLVLDHHAKFFITKGVVARGILIKASPTRSVWSLYRMIDASEVEEDRVMNLKIATPLELTEDSSRMIDEEDIPQHFRGRMKYYNQTSVPYYQGRIAPVYEGEPVPEYYEKGIPVKTRDGKPVSAEQLAMLKSRDEQDLESFAFNSEKELQDVVYVSHKDWELSSSLHVNALSSEITTDDETESDFSGSLSAIDFSIGIEKYFPNVSKWYRNFSLGVFAHKANQKSTSINDRTIETDVLEFGGKLTYHFKNPFATDQITPYGAVDFAFGSVKDNMFTEVASSSTSDQSASGSSTSFSLGGGLKYYTRYGIGFKTHLDFYRRTENYEFDTGNYTKVVQGPRLLLGVFMRW